MRERLRARRVLLALRALDGGGRDLGELDEHFLVDVGEFAVAFVERLDQAELLAVASAE
jgi:hypothetical protein